MHLSVNAFHASTEHGVRPAIPVRPASDRNPIDLSAICDVVLLLILRQDETIFAIFVTLSMSLTNASHFLSFSLSCFGSGAVKPVQDSSHSPLFLSDEPTGANLHQPSDRQHMLMFDRVN